jgi:Protein of unknown function, DUF488
VKSLFTIGHQSRTVDGLSERLNASRVGLVVDVRGLPPWHKHGFSKNALAEAPEGVGIACAYRLTFSTPKSMPTGYWRDPDFDVLKGAFDKRLENENHSLLELSELVRRWRAFLLDPALCHRSLVAAAGERRAWSPAKHL